MSCFSSLVTLRDWGWPNYWWGLSTDGPISTKAVFFINILEAKKEEKFYMCWTVRRTSNAISPRIWVWRRCPHGFYTKNHNRRESRKLISTIKKKNRGYCETAFSAAPYLNLCFNSFIYSAIIVHFYRFLDSINCYYECFLLVKFL